MDKRRRTSQFAFVGLLLLTLCGCGAEVAGVLSPKGVITFEERQLLFDSLALMMIVVLPVIIMSFAFVYRYNAKRSNADYKPDWCHSTLLESIWWGVPIAIILVLAIMTWTTTHELDPYNKIDVPGKSLQIKVVALPWKWLFIYPEQNIASVNHLVMPKGHQVEFLLTSDNVPMSAFFIPQLGSQIYTMAGMRTRLHLLATHYGSFEGLNSQYNGDGFSSMHFTVDVVTPQKLQQWFQKAKSSSSTLDAKRYKGLRQPSIAAPVQIYSPVAKNLFSTIIKSYESPTHPK